MNFGKMKSRIAREMKRGELSASSSAVQSAVLSAIKRFENRCFTWNEFQDEQITASASVSFVPLSRMTNIPVVIDSMKALIGNRDYPLDQKSYAFIDGIDSGQYYGYPEYYAFHGDQIRLYPPPNSDITLKISGVWRLPEISASASASASNGWTNDGEELVRLQAKAMLFRDELRNPQLADYFEGEAARVMRELSRRVTSFRGSGRVRVRRL